jgi:hypothetical protein
VERGHPRLRELLLRKLAWDPHQRFRSDWLDHHRELLGL